MPNWCNNTLRIEGPAEAIERFLDHSRQLPDYYSELGWTPPDPEVFDFFLDGTVPIPLEVCKAHLVYYDIAKISDPKTMSGKTTVSDPLRIWIKENLGAVTVMDAVLQDQSDECSVITFQTPWRPPLLWLERVYKKYPDLGFTLEYYESGEGLMGTATAEGDLGYVNEEEEITPAIRIEREYDGDEDAYARDRIENISDEEMQALFGKDEQPTTRKRD